MRQRVQRATRSAPVALLVRAGAVSLAVAAGLSGCTPAPGVDIRQPPRYTTSPSASATPTAVPSVELGIIDTPDVPLATIAFLAQNHWDGYIDGVYTAVFAGIDRHSKLGATPDAATAVFQYPAPGKTGGPTEIGIFHSGTGTTPLKITSERADTLYLSDGSPHGLAFSLFTDAFTAVSVPTAHGCSPTRTVLPADAVTAPIGDVDGDGRPDREWASQTSGGALTIGIETASHAVISDTEEFAGGAPRSGFVARLAHSTVAVASEQRDAALFALIDCHLAPLTRTSTGQHLNLSPVDVMGGDFTAPLGSGTTCSDGQLYALQTIDGGQRVVRTSLTVSGTVVRVGVPTTVTQRPDQEHVSAAATLSCGTAAVLHPPIP